MPRRWIGVVGRGASECDFGCSTYPLTITDPPAGVDNYLAIISSATTPDGSLAVILNYETASIYDVGKYVYDTSDWSLVDQDLLNHSFGSSLIAAGDDNYFYNMYAGGGVNTIWRFPILGAGGAPEVFATYSGLDLFVGWAGGMAFDTFGNMYAGGQDGETGDGVLLSLDRTTGERTVLYQHPDYEYIEPWCCTLDGAVWGIVIDTSAEYEFVGIFRWQGSMLILEDAPEPWGGLIPCDDSSIAYGTGPATGLGARITSAGEVGPFECLDGTAYNFDFNGPTGPHLYIPDQYLPDAQQVDCGCNATPLESPASGVYSIGIAAQTASPGTFGYDELGFDSPQYGEYSDRLYLLPEISGPRILISPGIRITRIRLTVTIATAFHGWEIGVALSPSVAASPNDASPLFYEWLDVWTGEDGQPHVLDTLTLDETIDSEWPGPGVGYILVDTFYTPGSFEVTGGTLMVDWEVM